MVKLKSETTKSQRAWIKHIFVSIGYGILFFFLISNILFSQRLPDLFFNLADEQADAMITFLKHGKEIPSFYLYESEIQEQLANHEAEIYKEERQRQELIQKLEVLLAQNPRSRDVLYSLYLLYDKSGDEMKAQQFLLRAKEIDPNVQN